MIRKSPAIMFVVGISLFAFIVFLVEGFWFSLQVEEQSRVSGAKLALRQEAIAHYQSKSVWSKAIYVSNLKTTQYRDLDVYLRLISFDSNSGLYGVFVRGKRVGEIRISP